MIYRLVDIGSTFTKINIIDLESEKILCKSQSTTTVKSGIEVGFNKAMEKIDEKYKKNISKTLFSSSAAGGLKITSIGLSKNLTLEASKRAALGAGARILGAYSYELSDEDVNNISESNTDIILLSGGTDYGNYKTVIYNAKQLTNLKRQIPIVVSCNIQAVEEIENIFSKANMKYYVCDNVMPKVNVLVAEPARTCIREIFMNNIVKAKGMENLTKEFGEILMPTPQAVLKAASLLSTGTKNQLGIGDLAIVDIGGATTDIHSIGTALPTDRDVRFEGLREPFEKRTVEGDLGMRYSAISLYESYSDELEKILGKDINVLEECKRRSTDTEFVPKNEFDLKIDAAIASVCTKISMARHTGFIRKEYSNGRYIYYQNGKDLRNIKKIIGTGGVLIHSKNPSEILKYASSKVQSRLMPQNASYTVDKNYILAAMGLLSQYEEDIALSIMKKYIEIN